MSPTCLVCGNNAKFNQGLNIVAFNKRNTSNTAQESNTSNDRTPRTTIAYVRLGIPLTDGTSIAIAGDLTIRMYEENAGHGTAAKLNGKTLECGGTKILSDSQKAKLGKNASVFVVYDGEVIGTISVSDTVRQE